MEKMKTKIEKTTPDEYGHEQYNLIKDGQVIFTGSLIGACKKANEEEAK